MKAPSCASQWLSVIRETFNLDSEVERYMSNRPSARRWVTTAASLWPKLALVSAQISHHAGVVNWGFMVFLLSGFGTYMKVTIFWVCWVVLAVETVVLSTLQPFFTWLEDEVSHPPASPDDDNNNNTSRFIWQTAAAMKVEEGTSNYNSTVLAELIMFYKLWTPILKLPLVILLLVLITSTTFTGELCAEGSTCYLRLKESLVAMLCFFFALEYLPCIVAIMFSTTDIPTFVASKMKTADIWVSIFCDIWPLRATSTHVAALRTQLLSDSISFTEVLAWEFRLMRGRRVSTETKAIVETISTTIWKEELYRMLSFFSSSFSAVLTLTVALLVGGSFGSFMTRKTYWVCWAFVSTEAFAESMLYITFFVGSGIKTLVRVTWVFRFVAHALLFGLMVQIIVSREYYAFDVRPECDKICQDRGVGLLKVACALSGMQFLSFVTSWYAWNMLQVLHTGALVFSFVYRRGVALVGLPVAVLVGFVLPMFCKGVVRSLLWVKALLCMSRQVSTSEAV